ncbi:MAG: GAF domain-containing protein [Anaerolineae bacterium]|nr:GAF domain-containing protein [Anaerolineae bacterium]
MSNDQEPPSASSPERALRTDAQSRLNAMLALLRGEKSRGDLAAEMGVSLDTVRRWEGDFVRAGMEALESENAALARSSDLVALHAMSQTLSTLLELDNILNASVEMLLVLFSYTACIGMIEGSELILEAGRRTDDQPFPRNRARLPLTDPTALTFAAHKGQRVNIADTSSPEQDPPFEPIPALGSVRSQIVLPISYKGAVLGVLSAYSNQPDTFSARDVHVLELVSANLGVAIENAQLFRQIGQRMRQLELLQSISANAIEGLDVEGVLVGAVQSLRQIMGYSLVAVGLTDPERSSPSDLIDVTCTSRAPGGEVTLETYRAAIDPRTVLGASVRGGLLLIDDLHNQNGTPLLGLHPESRSALAMPLRTGGESLGALCVESARSAAFSGADVEALSILGNQLSIAIRAARLFQQAQLRLQEISMFRHIADEANLGILTRDADGLITYANRAATAFFGFDSPDALQGTSVLNLYAEGQANLLEEHLEALDGQAHRAKGWTAEVLHSRRDGQIVASRTSLFPVHARDGNLLTCAMIFQDITRQRALTEEMRRANARFEALFAATTDGFIVWDEHRRIVMVNPSAARILEASADTLVGYRRGDPTPSARLEQVLLTPDGQPVELQGKRRCVVRCQTVPWSSGNASGELTILYDETDRASLESSREETITMLVHDLRSPLASVASGVELARQVLLETSDPAVAAHSLEVAQRGLQRVLEIADSLLDITRLEAGKLPLNRAPVDAPSLLQDAVAMLAEQAHAANVSLRANWEDGLPVIQGDAALLGRALNNLLDNALKFAPSGSIVEVSARREGGAGIRLSVIDSGPGIPEAYRNVIFEKYSQVPGIRGRRRGTGLGLALCRLVAEAHGGRAWVEPRPGGGSIFSFTAQSLGQPA